MAEALKQVAINASVHIECTHILSIVQSNSAMGSHRHGLHGACALCLKFHNARFPSFTRVAFDKKSSNVVNVTKSIS